MSHAPQSKAGGGGSTAAIVIIIVLVVGGALGLCACIPIGVALLLPAVQSGRDAARTMQSKNNLMQIGLALHNYHTVHGSLPPAYTEDENGNRLHSWRTLILPFLEQHNLYEGLDLNVAWDAPENWMAGDVSIPTYESPHDAGHGLALANYVLITGEGTMFPGSESTSIDDVRDGTSNTIMAVEIANSDIHWAEPRDVDINELRRVDEGDELFEINVIPRGAAILFGDGSVRKSSDTVDAATFRKFLTRDGGEQVVWTGD